MKNNDLIVAAKTVLMAMMGMFLISGVVAIFAIKEIVGLPEGKLVGSILYALVLFGVSFYASRTASRRKMIVVIVAGVIIFVLQLLIKSIAFAEGEVCADWRLVLSMVVSVLAGVLGSGKKMKRK